MTFWSTLRFGVATPLYPKTPLHQNATDKGVSIQNEIMTTNRKITSDINQWHVDHDPYGFIQSEEWLLKAEKTEDILQLQHVYADGPILDVGWYNGVFRVMVILNDNWEQPIEQAESKSESVVSEIVYKFMGKYANGA